MDALQHPLRYPARFPWRRALLPLTGATLFGFAAFLWFPPPPVRPARDALVQIGRSPTRFPNETSAISLLMNLPERQARFVALRAVDEDGDGVGEFGGMLELAGGAPPRGRDHALAPPLLSGAFKILKPNGTVRRAGYLFRMMLAARDGVPIAEAPGSGFPKGTIDPDAAELRWACYAWPEKRRDPPERTFVVTQSGDVWATDNLAYCGAVAPLPGAAMQSGGLQSFAGEPAEGLPAQDGAVWTKID